MEKENLDNGIKPDVIGLAVKGAAVREIKFRAWDESEKQMRYNLGICPTKYPDRVNFTFMFGAEGCTANPLQVPIMQSTGLKDKNGKEIYESDIVKFHDHPTGVEDGIGKVYWQDGKWMLTWSMIPLGDYGTAWTEVIGNIYENAGLLPL